MSNKSDNKPAPLGAIFLTIMGFALLIALMVVLFLIIIGKLGVIGWMILPIIMK